MQRIIVLGAGVIGLSTGITLLSQNHQVTIWAKDFPPNTTSNKAGAFWYPYLCDPKDKADHWAKLTAEYLHHELLSDPASGCFARTTIEIFREKQAEPWWHDAYSVYDHPPKTILPAGYVDGYQINGILMDTSIYLDYLVNRFIQAGGVMQQRIVNNLEEPLEQCDIVINCTGLGARELCHDDRLYPIRGQIVHIRPKRFDHILVDDEGSNGPMFILPRVHDMILGGTAQKHDWNTAIDPKDTADILKRCADVDPLFEHVDIISESVGLRPARDEVRLEAEAISDKVVIHNYGHGGAGFTLSWGSAADVVELVKRYGSAHSKTA